LFGLQNKKYPNGLAVVTSRHIISFSYPTTSQSMANSKGSSTRIKQQLTQAEYEEFLTRARLVLGLDKTPASRQQWEVFYERFVPTAGVKIT